jgi:hypothetical protein
MISPAAVVTRYVKPWMLIMASVLLVLPFLCLAFFTHPGSDDYYNSNWSNYLQAQKQLYNTWTGRYFSSLLLTLNPLHWHSLSAYRICSISVIILFCLSIWQLVSLGLKAFTDLSPTARATLATATIFLLLCDMPSPVQAFYWYAGFMTYCSSVILAGFLAILFMKIHATEQKHVPLAQRLAVCILTIAIIGCNELIAVACDLSIILLFLYYRRIRVSSLQRFYGWLTLICIICTAITVFAPGNTARHFHTRGETFTAVSTWLYYSFSLFRSWIAEPWVLLYSAIVLFLSPGFRLTNNGNLITYFLFPFAIILLLSFPNIWIMGTIPPGRIENVLFIFFLIAWLYFLLHCSSYFRSLWKGNTEATKIIRQLLQVFVIVCLLLRFDSISIRQSNYFILARSFFRHLPQAYALEMSRRDVLLFDPNINHVAVPPLPKDLRRGNLLLYTDLAATPNKFPNPGIAAFHHKSVVYIDTNRTAW